MPQISWHKSQVFDFTGNQPAKQILLALLAGDAIFILLGMLHQYSGASFVAGVNLDIGRDRSYSEYFMYLQEVATALILLFLTIRYRRFTYACFFLLLIYFFIDDSFKAHELWGERISSHFHFQPHLGLRPVDFGELIVSFFFVAGSLGSLALISLFEKDRDTRAFTLAMILLLAMLAFFGVFIDMADIMAASQGGTPLSLIEDAGEMIVISLITWLVAAKALSGRPARNNHVIQA